MSDKRAIGVFDSGLGGLTVVRELVKKMPNEDIIYFGDTGRVPYGSRSFNIIKRYAREDESFLLKHDVKLIVAACGTVSSVAADVSNSLPVPFFEVVSHAAEAAVKATSNNKIGVIGTSVTIKSQKHKEYILKIDPTAEIYSCSCPMFVPLVEEGWYSSDDSVVMGTVERYLTPIKEAGVDTLILGCTHYPVLSGAIREVMGNNVKLINAGTATAEAVYTFLNDNAMLNDGQNEANHKFYVSDKADSFRKIASSLLGEEIDESKVEQVDIGTV